MTVPRSTAHGLHLSILVHDLSPQRFATFETTRPRVRREEEPQTFDEFRYPIENSFIRSQDRL